MLQLFFVKTDFFVTNLFLDLLIIFSKTKVLIEKVSELEVLMWLN